MLSFITLGEVSEWFKEHAWKACVWGNLHRGFESRSLRQGRTNRNPRFWPGFSFGRLLPIYCQFTTNFSVQDRRGCARAQQLAKVDEPLRRYRDLKASFYRESLVSEIIQAQKSPSLDGKLIADLEHQINDIVYSMYGVNNDHDRAIIENVVGGEVTPEEVELEEVRKNLQEAIELYMESAALDDEAISPVQYEVLELDVALSPAKQTV